MTKKNKISVDEAINVLIEYHQEAGVPFALINASVGMVVSQGNAFELEAILNHAHKTLEMENAQRLFKIRQSIEEQAGPSEEEVEAIREALKDEQ